MKKLCTMIISFFALPAFAQPPAMPNQDQMMKMMMDPNTQKVMMAYGQCMQGVPLEENNALGEKTKAFEAEVKQLCATGQRDAAMRKAKQVGDELMDSQFMKHHLKCYDVAAPTFKAMGMPDPRDMVPNQSDGKHVCEAMQ